MDACIAAVDAAFRAQAAGATLPSGVLGTHVPGGGFHVKTAGLGRADARSYFAAKINANFPGNRALHGLPTIQGVISLHDATDGVLLAVLDSMEITTLRTAAATAVAARCLARIDARVITVLGCGIQGRSQLLALSRVRSVEQVFAWDLEPAVAEHYAVEMTRTIGCEVRSVAEYRAAVNASDIVVTCTPSRRPLLSASDVPPGCFVAAVGADNEDKQELAPDLLARSLVVVDVLEQCARIGDLHHALASGAMRRDDVHAELADVVSGRRPGRRSASDIIVFDSTGTALEDVAAAALVYERGVDAGRGIELQLGA
jgi:ornithine cyclodeaminase/alanine dehydrogenase-like protein (mu-crystallin family)